MRKLFAVISMVLSVAGFSFVVVGSTSRDAMYIQWGIGSYAGALLIIICGVLFTKKS